MSKLYAKGTDDFSPDMYDTSDVEIVIQDGKRRNEVVLVATSKSDFNLVKFYLALKAYVEKIEWELNVLEGSPEKDGH